MLNKTIASAPGKLMLFGEHAVIYGYPCIVTAVNQRIYVSVNKIKEKKIIISAPQLNTQEYQKDLSKIGKGDIPKEVKFIEIGLKNYRNKYSLPTGINIVTKSDFSSKFGFGSSSAVTVALIKALSTLFENKLSKKELFSICYKTVLDIQKAGSGFDIAAAIWGGTIYFISGGKVIKPLRIGEMPLVVGYTKVKADTSTLVRKVGDLYRENKKEISIIFSLIGDIVLKAKVKLISQDWKGLGKLMDINQGLLESLGVGSIELSKLIYAARSLGAYGAKLSGAGGGDCMITFTPNTKFGSIKKEITKKGGVALDVKTHAEGVKIEKA